MDSWSTLRDGLCTGSMDERLAEVYGRAAVPFQRERLQALMDAYAGIFGKSGAVGLFSGPGRTEMGGNHTDHQHGCVLAAAIDLDAAACAGANGSAVVHIVSEGYPDVTVDLGELAPRPDERESSAALVRGVAARMAELGFAPGGFNACVSSNVLGGSGLSSSAAYEVLIGVIFNHLFCGDALSMVQIAQIGQFAENRYFGKPCGLMDQLTSAVGGVVSIDFADTDAPIVQKVVCDPAEYGYALCIIDSGASHMDLTEEYAAIPGEMGAVAAHFGKRWLREVDEAVFRRELPAVRAAAGDRAVLRAMHFFADNALAPKQALALRQGDFETFLAFVNSSGRSSALQLQNLSCSDSPNRQAIPIALACAGHILCGRGAVRVHGGGFAGTVQAYVPLDMAPAFRAGMEAVLGVGCCHFLRIRSVGGAVLA